MGEDLGQGELHAQPLAQARDQLHRQQRVPAEGKEVVVAADLLDAEQLAPQRGQDVFEFALRGDIGLQIQCLSVRRRQGGAI